MQALHGKLKPHGGIAKVLQSVKAGSGSHGMFFSFVSGCCNKALRELNRREGALVAYCYNAGRLEVSSNRCLQELGAVQQEVSSLRKAAADAERFKAEVSLVLLL